MQQRYFWPGLAGIVVVATMIWIVVLSVFPGQVSKEDVSDNKATVHSRPPRSIEKAPPSSAAAFPEESPRSNDPIERAIAEGTVLDTRIDSLASDNHLRRVRIVQSGVQDRLLRVVERWDVREGQATLQSREMFLADQLIVRATEGLDKSTLEKALGSSQIQVLEEIAPGLFTLRLPSAEIDAIPKALETLAALPEIVKSAEADGVGFGGGIPNDPEFGNQWGHRNVGQFSGLAGTDVDASEFWDIVGSTPGLVIAVLDTGLNFTHPDLQGVAWVNPSEVPSNGIDDDGSGRIDDMNGWDFVNNDNNATDDHGHGSNVSGIIIANRNNGMGIAGLLSGAKILVGKILNSSNSGLTSNLIAGLAYGRARGVKLINLSLQSYPFSSNLSTEISACETAGILLLASAGNQGTNNDTSPNYPSSYSQANVLAVGNHASNNTRWSSSNFGAASVDIFAPGQLIRSTFTGTSYSYFTGTSQATAYVTAISGAIKFIHPQWTPAQIKAAVLDSVVTATAYQGICVSGGRLNALQATAESLLQNPTLDTDGDQVPNLIEYLSGTLITDFGSSPAITQEVVSGVLRISIPHVPRPEATLEVEASTDLVTWGTVGVLDFSVPGMLIRGVSLSTPKNQFLRVKAVSTPP
ncbi:MAG: S8 family peptidase [Terrimicrobiaceae bacterium]